ncbi:Secretory peroxidase [Sesbania bispinosa]|nr:Secretory peroxidase [Sesbania bispinosa]
MNSFRAVATAVCCVVVVLGGLPFSSDAQLDPSFYKKTCPQLHSIVHKLVWKASLSDPRIFASLVRLHFHDCFVLGCDASILLNNTATIVSEQQALPNNNSIRGLDVVNNIKTAVEKACPGIVSCADILALAAEASSALAFGPCWKVPLGRRDGLTANRTLANINLPAPFFTLDQLKKAFSDQGLDTTDLVALSGAHTFGRAHCSLFQDRLYNFNNTGKPDPTLDTTYLQTLSKICPNGGPGTNLANFDPTTPDKLDKNYYSNLKVKKGLLQSDQELFSTPGADTISIVNKFASSQDAFFESFKASMIKMGNIGVLTGKKGEIRKQFIGAQNFKMTCSVLRKMNRVLGVGHPLLVRSVSNSKLSLLPSIFQFQAYSSARRRLIADLAEAEGHHPDLHLVGWNNVTIEIWTHSVAPIPKGLKTTRPEREVLQGSDFTIFLLCYATLIPPEGPTTMSTSLCGIVVLQGKMNAE